MIRVLSLGAGVQSSVLALMAAHGEIDAPDCAIFADTQGEPAAVYTWLDWLEKQLPFPVHRATAGSLWDSATRVRRTRDGERTYVATGIPAYIVGPDGSHGIGKRQCTRTFKIDVITRTCRTLLGKTRIPATSEPLVEMLVGISTDEAHRAKPNRLPWIKTRWPLLEKGMSRADCLMWMTRHGYPRPPRSACTYCPYRSDDSWLALTPEEFQDAVEKERQLQEAYAAASAVRGVPYLHASRVPLSQVVFRPGARKASMDHECEGICGV